MRYKEIINPVYKRRDQYTISASDGTKYIAKLVPESIWPRYDLFHNDQQIGGFFVHMVEWPAHGKEASVHRQIHPDHQRKGLGLAMARIAREIARENGYRFVEPHNQSEKSKAFWNKHRDDLIHGQPQLI